MVYRFWKCIAIELLSAKCCELRFIFGGDYAAMCQIPKILSIPIQKSSLLRTRHIDDTKTSNPIATIAGGLGGVRATFTRRVSPHANFLPSDDPHREFKTISSCTDRNLTASS